ncbi:MAG: IS1380 family transposase, partial [Gemmataceae bacterium]
LILTVAMLAFNTLRFIGQKALTAKGLLPVKTDVERKRLRKVIDDLIRIGCKLARHGRSVFLCIWEQDPWLPVFRELHRSFEAL